ncbi:TonB-dependent siderophore receptor [compost metagenome]
MNWQDAYALVNLMARYEITDNLSAQVNANNVTDEKYLDIFDAYGALTYGAPRSLTATAKYRFQGNDGTAAGGPLSCRRTLQKAQRRPWARCQSAKLL